MGAGADVNQDHGGWMGIAEWYYQNCLQFLLAILLHSGLHGHHV